MRHCCTPINSPFTVIGYNLGFNPKLYIFLIMINICFSGLLLNHYPTTSFIHQSNAINLHSKVIDVYFVHNFSVLPKPNKLRWTELSSQINTRTLRVFTQMPCAKYCHLCSPAITSFPEEHKSFLWIQAFNSWGKSHTYKCITEPNVSIHLPP